MAGFAVHVAASKPAALGDLVFGAVPGAAHDAAALAALTAAAGFSTVTLAGSDASVGRVLGELRDVCGRAVAGDVIVWSFAGHGWQLSSADPAEPDGFDEILMLADGFIVDTSLGSLFHGCQTGVGVVAIVDACRSRTSLRVVEAEPRDVPLSEVLEVVEVPDVSGSGFPGEPLWRPAATVLSLAAVDRDDASAYGDERGGVFTTALEESFEQLCEAGVPSWGQLFSRTVGHVLSNQAGLELGQRPFATLAGPDLGLLARPAFRV